MKNIYIILLLFLLLLCCRKNDDWSIDLPETKKIPNINQWAFVDSPNLKLRENPVVNSDIINYMPVGSMLQIIKKEDKLTTFNNEVDYWYYVDYEGERGWIFGSFIRLYNTYEEAEKNCVEMLSDLLKEEESKNNGKEKKQ